MNEERMTLYSVRIFFKNHTSWESKLYDREPNPIDIADAIRQWIQDDDVYGSDHPVKSIKIIEKTYILSDSKSLD